MLTDIYLNGTAIINASALTTDKRLREIRIARIYFVDSHSKSDTYMCVYGI